MEIYPDFVVKNKLNFIVDSEIISLVIEALSTSQKSFDNQKVIEATNYYMKYDTLNIN